MTGAPPRYARWWVGEPYRIAGFAETASTRNDLTPEERESLLNSAWRIVAALEEGGKA